ncbi:hypothetical protein H2248_011290 [Termitomyces sp. 'cryptogamus']|nr:hypothetical protein H2248_011290 [Termitomyces sp. 'cryptogamus']
MLYLYDIKISSDVYYQCFPEDNFKIKALVYGTFFLDTRQSVLVAADAFHWLAHGFGNMKILSETFITPFDTPMLGGIVAFVGQTFFCWRIRVLHKSWWLPSVVFFVSRLERLDLNRDPNVFAVPLQVTVVSLVGGIACSIGAFQVADLLRLRRGEITSTDDVLTRIVRLTVETNAVTASVAIISVVCILVVTNVPTMFMTPTYIIGKLYSNTLLAVLNNRIYMSSRGTFPRRRIFPSTEIEVQFRQTPSESSQGGTTETLPDSRAGPYGIQVFREVEITKDIPPQNVVPRHPCQNFDCQQ